MADVAASPAPVPTAPVAWTPPLDLQGGMMALVALRDAAAKVFRLTTAGRLIAVFRTVTEVAARD